MMFKKYSKEKERRRYIRLDSVFPVEFCIEDKSGKVISGWLQGFTSNISKGGLCLCVNNLPEEFILKIKQEGIKFILKIEIPLRYRPIEAKAKVVWIELVDKGLARYHIGLNYERILPQDNKRILRYCIAKKITLPLILIIISILLIGFGISTYINLRLLQTNKALVEQFVDILQKSSSARREIQKLNKEKQDLELKLQEMELHLKNLNEERKIILESQKKRLIEEEIAKDKINTLLKMIKELEKERQQLKEKIHSVQTKETQITEDLLLLDRKKIDLEKVNVEKMYQWLKLHQNPRTGLILSYEGDKDLQNISFLYDQALLAIAYTRFSDFERARKIFDFFRFKAKKIQGGFLNAYYT
ncbi:MAG: PilZ domain-containing protein, partial [Candidatus Omnitrophica bacterium]|nr:PilZ domain-containing protein [Candidatus Omnitrophota bacterium]